MPHLHPVTPSCWHLALPNCAVVVVLGPESRQAWPVPRHNIALRVGFSSTSGQAKNMLPHGPRSHKQPCSRPLALPKPCQSRGA